MIEFYLSRETNLKADDDANLTPTSPNLCSTGNGVKQETALFMEGSVEHGFGTRRHYEDGFSHYNSSFQPFRKME